jgi:hypothetical protein
MFFSTFGDCTIQDTELSIEDLQIVTINYYNNHEFYINWYWYIAFQMDR